MKKLICTSLLALSFATANAAMPHVPGYYVKGEVGMGMFTNSAARKALGSPIVFGLAVGHKPHDMFRAELDLRYKQKSKSGNKFTQFTGLLNGFYDIQVHSMFTPYITAGVGYASVKMTPKGVASTTVGGLAYNAGLGAMVHVAKDVDVDLSYRYIGLSSKRLQPSSALNSHELTLGLIYHL